jgi:phosphoribosylformylglycinamidine (FGAM) synthase PurS component
VGAVAYEIELPPRRKIHNVFHVSCLKKEVGQHVTTNEEFTLVVEEVQLIFIPEEILDMKEKMLINRIIKEYMIKWKNLPIEDATWEAE